ncbi:MAG: C25 family cysteine peptidase [candidate division WOR-3 bacterium]
MSWIVVNSLFGAGARYLIIAHDDFVDAIQPLVEWKQKKGVSCAVVKKSEIGSTNTAIRNFIKSVCDTWEPRPEFLLLVGSAAKIPCFRRGPYQWRANTDSRYADISGDYVAELPYGRFPCKTVRQCSTMVARTVAYERWPDLSDSTWYGRATLVVRDSGDNDGWRYWEDVHYVADLATRAGFSNFDSLCSSRRDDSADVMCSVAEGTSFVLYRGHGVDTWFAPFSIRSLLAGLSNSPRWPIICSFTCQTISLDSLNDSMTGNTWVRLGTPGQPHGAVAVVGNTHSGINVAHLRSAVTRGFFRRLFSDSIPHLGAAVLAGKFQQYSEYGDSLDYYGFNLFGDPELNVWTGTPMPIDLEANPMLRVGTDTLRLVVRRSGAPVRNALVCIRHVPDSTRRDSVYSWAYTDSSGSVEMPVVTTECESLELTITGCNCLPYEGYVWADTLQSGVARSWISPRSSLTLDVVPGLAQGRVVISCSQAAHVKVVDRAGRTMRVFELMKPAEEVILNARVLPAGVYFVRAQASSGATVARTLTVTK